MKEKRTKPSWTTFLDDHFDVSATWNVSTAFVLIFKAVGRTWALSFGNGFHAIDLGAVEPGFGLRVCANSLDPGAIRSMENRRLGPTTRQQRTHVSRGTRIEELGVTIDQDWVRYLAGRSGAEDLKGTLTGSDPLSLTTDLPLAELPTLCQRILERYHAEDYREWAGFIDQLRPLRSGERLVEQLDAEVERRLQDRDTTDLHLAPPEIPDDSRLAGYRVWASRRRHDIDELNILDLFEAFDALPTLDSYLDRAHIAEISDEGSVGPRDPLRRYLVAEIEDSGKLYVHSLGWWFEIDTGYAASITRQVAALDDVTAKLRLPPWDETREKDYNKRVADDREWVFLDDDPIHHGGRGQKVEWCDLLTDEEDHLYVKRAESSATLSHLFNQAAVVCELYRQDPDFNRKAKKKLASVAPDRSFPDLTAPRFVYAIGTKKPGPLSESLFFMSKLNLVAKAKEIHGRGSRVAIAKIQMT